MPAKLSVNINKWATIRNARGHNNPDLIKTATDIQNFGGQGITIHPRPDEALCDGPQALVPSQLNDLSKKVSSIAKVIGRTLN